MFVKLAVIAAAVSLIITAAVYAGVGSVISSFAVPGTLWVSGACYDGDFVYVTYYPSDLPGVLIYTPAGQFVGGFDIWPTTIVLEDPDHSFAGARCLSVAIEGAVGTYSKANGDYLGARHNDLLEIRGYGYWPGNPYYYIGVAPWPTFEPYTILPLFHRRQRRGVVRPPIRRETRGYGPVRR